MLKDSTGRLFDLFADLLEYPAFTTPLKAGLCYEQLQMRQSEAGRLLESFYHHVDQRTTDQMQELYTGTFDMQPVCYPYVGYHLFGESYKRGAFMAHLNEAYRSSSFSAGKELPDHICVILRFLGQDEGKRRDDFGRVLLREGLTPALEKMTQALRQQPDNPYTGVVSALLLVLRNLPETEPDHA
jgi:nitrate reductase delta subunit